MTNAEIRYVMMKHLSKEIWCNADDFLSDTNKVYKTENDNEQFFRMMCFGNAAVARVNEKIYDWCRDFVSEHIGFRCFDGSQFSVIAIELTKYGLGLGCGQGMVADMNFKRENKSIPYKTRIINKTDIKRFYDDEVEGKFYKSDVEWRMLPYSEATEYIIAAYDSDKVIGFVVADKNTDIIYDVGYETLPEYRQKGIATAITIEMTDLLLNKGFISYAGLAWSNVSSKNVLIKSGYTAGWSNMGSHDN